MESLAATFVAAGIRCEAVQSLTRVLWMKLVWNIPFNGLAITEGGVDTSQLLGALNKEEEIRSLMHEVIRVANALGLSLSDSLVDQQIELTRPMQSYRPSSMIDFVEGREVEFNAIWELPLQKANELSVDVPSLELLVEKLNKVLKV